MGFFLVVDARLGETFDQCVERYGSLIERQGSAKNPQLVFAKDGITVGINFLGGKAAQISYSKEKGCFEDAEVQQLLAVNSGGSKWKYDPAESTRQRLPSVYDKQVCFMREDGGAFATHLRLKLLRSEFVEIASAEYRKAIG